MAKYNIDTFSADDATGLIRENVEAVLIVDAQQNRIKPLIKKGIFSEFLKDDWSYLDLIENLWYHFSDSDEKIAETYHVFFPSSGKFNRLCQQP